MKNERTDVARGNGGLPQFSVFSFQISDRVGSGGCSVEGRFRGRARGLLLLLLSPETDGFTLDGREGEIGVGRGLGRGINRLGGLSFGGLAG